MVGKKKKKNWQEKVPKIKLNQDFLKYNIFVLCWLVCVLVCLILCGSFKETDGVIFCSYFFFFFQKDYEVELCIVIGNNKKKKKTNSLCVLVVMDCCPKLFSISLSLSSLFSSYLSFFLVVLRKSWQKEGVLCNVFFFFLCFWILGPKKK